MPSIPETTVRRCGLALLAAAGLVLAGCGSETPPVAKLTAAEVEAQLAEAPTTPVTPAATRLESQAGKLIDAGGDPVGALEAQVRKLRGTPVVVNLWGDWCDPCKREMPIFQRVALDRRGQTAFFGVAVQSRRAKAEAYLRDQIFVPYPSILDEDGKVNVGTGVNNLPKTFFYDKTGKRTIHVGPYESEAALVTDIERYAQ